MKTLFVLAALACMTNDECKSPLVCVTGMNGTGICGQHLSKQDQAPNGTCVFPSDCDDGFICARPHGYLQYGHCMADVKHERNDNE